MNIEKKVFWEFKQHKKKKYSPNQMIRLLICNASLSIRKFSKLEGCISTTENLSTSKYS